MQAAFSMIGLHTKRLMIGRSSSSLAISIRVLYGDLEPFTSTARDPFTRYGRRHPACDSPPVEVMYLYVPLSLAASWQRSGSDKCPFKTCEKAMG